MKDLDHMLAKLGELKRSGNGYLAHCPAHYDKRKSLSVSSENGKILIHCHAGCETRSIVQALGLKMSDLFIGNVESGDGYNHIVKVYDYHDQDGTRLFQVCRKANKSFLLRRPDGKGGYIYGLGDVNPVLYRLPEVIEAVKNDETIYIPEGEKDVDNLIKIGLTATTNPMGAGKWKDYYSDFLTGADVVIIPDKDQPGFKHAEKVARSLYQKVNSLKVLVLEDLPDKGDVSDWLENGGTADQLKLMAEKAPLWEPDKLLKTYPSWPDPEKIELTLLPVEKLPPMIITEPLRDWAVDVSYRMQTPIDFTAAAIMVMCGALIGSSCGIKPKQKDDWLVIPNLWGGIVGRPGSMKSPAINEALKPLSVLETEAKERYDQARSNYEAEKEIYKAQKEALKAEMAIAAKGKGSKSLDDLKYDFLALEPPSLATWQRFKTNDSTVEKMAEILQENPRGILLYRDELIGLLKSWEREGRQADRAFFLEAWNGHGSLTTDRIGRGTIHCNNLCLSILGGIQPSKLLAYLYQAQSELENDGLIQRMQFMVYPDEAEKWTLIDEYPNQRAKEKAYRVIKNLSELDVVKHGAITSPDQEIPYFHFDKQAQDLFNQWLISLQAKLQNKDDPPVILEHLNKYRSLMPSISLIDHLIHIADGATGGKITLQSAEKAAAWCGYLESHARRIYQMAIDVNQRAASELANKLINKRLKDPFTVRDVYRKSWYLLNDKEKVRVACEELEEAGWLRKASIPVEGRQSKVVYQINPKIYSKMADDTTAIGDIAHQQL